jgi:hypothetical protein
MHFGPLTTVVSQSVYENRVESFVLELLDTDSQERITGLDVTIRILGDNGILVSSWTTVVINGLYYVNVTMPPIGEYTLEIQVALEHYSDFKFSQPLISTADPQVIQGQILTLVFTGVAGALSLVFALAVAVVTRRRLHSRRTERALETLAIKNRFDDARNILGGLILRRTDGLPVFSKIVSGVFEEAMTSGFISAITSFRTEISDDEETGVVIPISDVISAIMTPALTFALITYASPSDSQRLKLQEFSERIGEFFGDELGRQTARVPETWIADTVGDIFSAHFDLSLLQSYCGIQDDFEAKGTDQLRDLLSDSDEGLTPDEMIKELLRMGIDEGRAYRLIIDTIDSNSLIGCADTDDPEDAA